MIQTGVTGQIEIGSIEIGSIDIFLRKIKWIDLIDQNAHKEPIHYNQQISYCRAPDTPGVLFGNDHQMLTDEDESVYQRRTAWPNDHGLPDKLSSALSNLPIKQFKSESLQELAEDACVESAMEFGKPDCLVVFRQNLWLLRSNDFGFYRTYDAAGRMFTAMVCYKVSGNFRVSFTPKMLDSMRVAGCQGTNEQIAAVQLNHEREMQRLKSLLEGV